jgi:hypothetical protein
MSNIVAFSGANLPSVNTLKETLARVQSDVGSSGMVIIKMDKTGTWVFGADQTEVEEGSAWAVNPFSFVHGWVGWGGDKTPMKGQVLGEKMCSVAQPLPEQGEVPEHCTKGWELQMGFSLKCVSGEDAGMEARYTATSVGAKKAIQALAVEIASQVDKDSTKPVPVVELKSDSYRHKTYGKIFTPVFEVKQWVGINGEKDAPPKAEEPAPAPEEGGRRRRRSAA